MALLLLFGLYFPTSLAEEISKDLAIVASAILFPILTCLLLRNRGTISPGAVANAAALNCILLVCTLFSPLTEFAYGGYLPILLLSMLLCLNLIDVPLTLFCRRLFLAANVVNIALGTLLILQTEVVVRFFEKYYAFAYPELVSYMIAEGKPVITFGSHSLAGFFFYLFFYLTFQTFAAGGGKTHLILALGYLSLLTFLNSFTALVLAGFAALQLVMHFQWHKSVLAGILATSLLLAGVGFAVTQTETMQYVRTDLWDVLNREDNGLLGRYSASGGLLGNLQYIADNPFSPIGLGLSRRLWYADSGPVEYIMKGSYPLLLSVYAGLFLFLRKNLVSKRRAMFLFLVFIGFEAGYSNLQYLRTQYLLPFLIVYLNAIDCQARIPGRRPAHA